MVPFSITLIDPDWDFKVAIFYDIGYLRNDGDTAIVTIERQ